VLALLLAATWGLACAGESHSGAAPGARTSTHTAATDGVQPERGTRSAVGCAPGELDSRSQRRLEGRASYYHDSLAGNRTASGERYRPERLTAAHRTLPFGTRLRVWRTDAPGSPTVCVTVNDRGPFAGRGRVLDLSRRAAEQLGMIRSGVVPVRADVVTASR
jgi:rare lipoprotein A